MMHIKYRKKRKSTKIPTPPTSVPNLTHSFALTRDEMKIILLYKAAIQSATAEWSYPRIKSILPAPKSEHPMINQH